MNAKQTAAWLLAPAARLATSLGRLQRLWAYASLAAHVKGPVDPSVVVLRSPDVQGTGQIRLGPNLFLYPDLHLETRQTGFIEIGANVVISRGVHIVSHAGIVIGANSMIGEYTSIRDANHRFGDGSPIRNSGYAAAPIHIGENVWIARGVAILRGVTIGDHAVIGANAVVTQPVPSGTVVVGVPAQPIRRMAPV